MSKASEMRAMGDTLTMYPLMTAKQVSKFLGCTDEHVRGLLKAGKIPFTDIGVGSKAEYRIDPMDAAVFHLSQREGVTAKEFWERHGPQGTPDLCRTLINQIRRLNAA